MQLKFDNLRQRVRGALACLRLALLAIPVAAALQGQTFSSGSTGADGDLIISAPGVTVFTTAPSGGGSIYNFKTIQIASGSTLKLSGAVFSGPLYFLASGAVTIAGTIDLSGQNGSVPATAAQRTVPATPGPGGYGGGLAAFGGNPAVPGFGPNGGGVNDNSCTPRNEGIGGGTSATQFLVPLVGGSGGGGAIANGGAGGGALLIASSVSITVSGVVTAVGGSGAGVSYVGSGGGAGGGLRLVAPVVSGSGTITAAGGATGFQLGGCTNPGASGIVRIESFQYTFTGTVGGTLYTASPVALFLPAVTGLPTISVTTINGINIPPNPTGSFTVPDVLLNSTSPLAVSIHASNIPLGTIPTLHFYTQNFPDQTITATAGLAGTVGSSTTTATVTLNPGYSIGLVTATWSQ